MSLYRHAYIHIHTLCTCSTSFLFVKLFTYGERHIYLRREAFENVSFVRYAFLLTSFGLVSRQIGRLHSQVWIHTSKELEEKKKFRETGRKRRFFRCSSRKLLHNFTAAKRAGMLTVRTCVKTVWLWRNTHRDVQNFATVTHSHSHTRKCKKIRIQWQRKLRFVSSSHSYTRQWTFLCRCACERLHMYTACQSTFFDAGSGPNARFSRCLHEQWSDFKRKRVEQTWKIKDTALTTSNFTLQMSRCRYERSPPTTKGLRIFSVHRRRLLGNLFVSVFHSRRLTWKEIQSCRHTWLKREESGRVRRHRHSEERRRREKKERKKVTSLAVLNPMQEMNSFAFAGFSCFRHEGISSWRIFHRIHYSEIQENRRKFPFTHSSSA